VGRTTTDYRLVDALAGTMRSVFPTVFVVDTGSGFTESVVYGTRKPTSVRAFRQRALASGNPKLTPIIEEALSTGNLREVQRGGIVFTDDLAPVERMIDQIILGYIRGSR
jgi:hypothetical protein